ncbi:hypothetical protein OIU77_010963 [Salix suchowensis]|uniref:Ribosomal protein L6 n=1 Tax=Salix suchowensis TaxID=1278906 RepID=A0ABQ9AB44_9ROSI|nr:hypothetical protein OIU77_010963 [Salix suchowensis]
MGSKISGLWIIKSSEHNLRSAFFGERNGICIPSVPVTRIGFLRKAIECKESRIGKQPIQVPSNVTITLEGQDLKVKGPLGELSRSYPREVKLERDWGWNHSGQKSTRN